MLLNRRARTFTCKTMQKLKSLLHRVAHSDKHKTDPVNGSTESDESNEDGDEYSATTQQAIDLFLAWKLDNGEIQGLGYWQTANAYSAIALHDYWSRSTQYISLLHERLGLVSKHHNHFINEFNDDTLWWGVCILDVYHSNHQAGRAFVNDAYHILERISHYQIGEGEYEVDGKDMDGAVYWTSKEGEEQVNTVSTALFAEFLARMTTLDGPLRRQGLLPAAVRAVEWVLRCRYRENEGCCTDHILVRKKECVDWTFTYNTGQMIAACLALFLALRKEDDDGMGIGGARRADEYLEIACKMARKSLTRKEWVNEDGVLVEHGAYGRGKHDPRKNDDAVGFKAVLLRSLSKLHTVLLNHQRDEALRRDIAAFVKKQFDALQEKNTDGEGRYGPWWDGPFEVPTSHSQLAALDVMAAVHVLKHEKKSNN